MHLDLSPDRPHLLASAHAAAAWLGTSADGASSIPVDYAGRVIVVECAYCGRVRNQRKDWAHLPESLLPESHSLSHGICPVCVEQEFPEYACEVRSAVLTAA